LISNYAPWLSRKRDTVLAVSGAWESYLALHGGSFGVPAAQIARLHDLRDSAKALYDAAYNAARTPAITAELNEAFDLLREHMMSLKERYFHTPPLAEKDYAALMLTPRDKKPTYYGSPQSRVAAVISYSGAHGLIVNLENAPGEAKPQGVVFMTLFEGIMPPGGAPAAEVARNKLLLMEEPASIADLIYWRRTSRRKEERVFDAAYAGMTAYFAARYENQRGEKGPPGFIVKAVIP
jgi:hypothetical protein